MPAHKKTATNTAVIPFHRAILLKIRFPQAPRLNIGLLLFGGPAENRTRAPAMRMLCHTTRPQAQIVSRETIKLELRLL